MTGKRQVVVEVFSAIQIGETLAEWPFFSEKIVKTSSTRQKNTQISIPGHMISTEIEIGVETHKIISVYAPKTSMRRNFFKELTLKEKTKNKVILGGDFNFVENPEIDRTGEETSGHTTGANECRIFTENHRLVDAFRVEFPSKKAYTFTTLNQPIRQISSRLDRIYIPENASKPISKIEEGRYWFTDHQMVTTSFSPEGIKPVKKGKSHWKHDACLLEDPLYVDETNSVIDDYLNYDKISIVSLISGNP